jgi:hypothetical protein
MKKLTFLVLALVSLSAFAQTKSETTKYLAVGYSIGNHVDGKSLDETSYPSLEYGVTRNNLSLGLVVGRGATRGIAQTGDNLAQYYYEGKVTQAFPFTKEVSGNVVLGLGSYFITDNAVFVEYGFGLTRTIGKITYGLTYSNWDKVDYVTPSLSYSF